MKFLHTADIHLGAKPDAGRAYSEIRASEIWDSLAELVGICEEEQVDLLLLAGDLFHHQPLLRELKEVNYLFSKLTHTKIVLIAGNHDYIKPSSYYLSFQWSANVFPLLQRELDFIEFPELQTCVYGFSYYSKEIVDSRYDDAYAGKRQQYEILLAHGGDDRHIPLKKAKLTQLGYDYIALGHIHKPQELVPSQIYYAGAPEPLDKNDTGVHGYMFGEITDEGVKAVFVPSAKRQYVHREITVQEQMTGRELREEICRQIEGEGLANIYKLTLTGYRDPEVLFDLEAMDKYGNIIEIIDETQPAYDFDKLARQNADNLLGKFIERFQGHEPGSIESQALYEGVQAIVQAKRGVR